MTNLPDRESTPNWVENSEGEILPSYTGSNVPRYRNPSGLANREDLEEIHSQPEAVEIDPTKIVDRIRVANNLPRATELPTDADRNRGITYRYDEGRKDVLGR
jgi:hypothetical protein